MTVGVNVEFRLIGEVKILEKWRSNIAGAQFDVRMANVLLDRTAAYASSIRG
jgi:hypothetical protein